MPTHPLPPVFDSRSAVLILGSFPSAASRREGFYYAHPQNRFWRILAALWDEPVPGDREPRRAFLLSHRIALWDVAASCDISGSSDASIKNVKPNDVALILRRAPITDIFTTGRTAKLLYDRLILPDVKKEAVCLPSPSAANAAFGLERLIRCYQPVKTAADANSNAPPLR